MQRNRLLKLIMYYKPTKNGNTGRPRNRWKDQSSGETSWNRLYSLKPNQFNNTENSSFTKSPL